MIKLPGPGGGLPFLKLFGFWDPLKNLLGDILEAIIIRPFMALFAVVFVTFLCGPIASATWFINKIMIYISLLFSWINQILVETIFANSFNLIADRLQAQLLPFVFTVAVFILGISYVMAAFWLKDANIVDWKKAVAWLLFAIMFYSGGVDLFIASDSVRRAMGTVIYTALLGCDDDGANCDIADANDLLGPFAGPSVGGYDGAPMADLTNNFGGDISYDKTIDGTDVAMAYILADRDDVLSAGDYSTWVGLTLFGLPDDFANTFFGCLDDYGDIFASIFDEDNGCTGFDIISDAFDGWLRLFFGMFLNFFGIIEQYVNLLITIGMIIIFLMLLWGVLFSFFNYTEKIAIELMKQWLNMIMLGIYASIVLGMGVFILILGASAGNIFIPIATTYLAIGLGLIATDTVTNVVKNLIKTLPQTFAQAVTGSQAAQSRVLDSATSSMAKGISGPNEYFQNKAMSGMSGKGLGGAAGGQSATTGINDLVKPGASGGGLGGMKALSGGSMGGGGGSMIPGGGAAFGPKGSPGLSPTEGSMGGLGGMGGGGGDKQQMLMQVASMHPKGKVAVTALQVAQTAKGMQDKGGGGKGKAGGGMGMIQGGSSPLGGGGPPSGEGGSKEQPPSPSGAMGGRARSMSAPEPRWQSPRKSKPTES